MGDEVDVLVERVVGGLDLLLDAEQPLGLGERQHHLQLAEVGRIHRAPRLPVVEFHEVVVDPRQRVRLVVVPKGLGVHADPFVHHRLAIHLGGDAARRHLDELVVRIPIHEWPGNEPRLERLIQEDFAVRVLGHELKGGRVLFGAQFVSHVAEIERQRLGEDLVRGEHRVLPAERGVHRLLRPILGRPVLAEQEPHSRRGSRAVPEREQLRQDKLLDPPVALPVGGKDRHVAGGHRGSPAPQLGDQLVLKRGADLGGFAQLDHDPDPVATSDGRKQLVPHDAPEFLDLGGHLENLLVEDRGVVHVPVIEFDRRFAEAEPFGGR